MKVRKKTVALDHYGMNPYGHKGFNQFYLKEQSNLHGSFKRLEKRGLVKRLTSMKYEMTTKGLETLRAWFQERGMKLPDPSAVSGSQAFPIIEVRAE